MSEILGTINGSKFLIAYAGAIIDLVPENSELFNQVEITFEYNLSWHKQVTSL